ncbi:MAG TPA: AraC family transcriptional regulator [Hanamia sp.]|nr:AraC family transcriptional regulator [Hanamia sp.]
MKPILMRHVETTTESFKAWTNGNPYSHNPWHYHPECELTAIDEGKGVLFVGDYVTNYEKNDLILIGPNLPHEYRSSIKETPDFLTKSTSIHFRKDFPGGDFYKIPEAKIIFHILEQSKRGIKFNDPIAQKKVKEKLSSIIQAKGIERINILFSILEIMAYSEEQEYLSSQSFIDSIEEDQDQKMYKIYKYIMANFKEQISIDLLASEVNMTKTSFCRFFKKRTNKSLVQYINEIRIGYACKMLYSETYNISEAAYESGFENISNFNKQFMKVKKKTPSQVLAQFANEKK